MKAFKQYTLRNIPNSIDSALRKKAKIENKSLNQIIVETLEAALGIRGPAKKYHDLDSLSGAYKKDESFENALKEVRSVDPKDWK